MNFEEIAKERFSCRKYTEQIPEKSLLEKVLNAARIAPSAKNLQPWRFVVVQEEELLSKIKDCYPREWIQHLNTIIVAIGNHNQAWRRKDGKDHTDIDLAIAIDHMTLAATESGLATCWICMFDALKCSELLALGDGEEAIALLPVGYPAVVSNPSRHEKLRRPLDDMVSWR